MQIDPELEAIKLRVKEMEEGKTKTQYTQRKMQISSDPRFRSRKVKAIAVGSQQADDSRQVSSIKASVW